MCSKAHQNRATKPSTSLRHDEATVGEFVLPNWIGWLLGYALLCVVILSIFAVNDDEELAMGHYDSCRPGYCPSCGAAPGNMVNGVCEFCGTEPNPPERPSVKGRWEPPHRLPPTPAPAAVRQAAYEEYMERT